MGTSHRGCQVSASIVWSGLGPWTELRYVDPISNSIYVGICRWAMVGHTYRPRTQEKAPVPQPHSGHSASRRPMKRECSALGHVRSAANRLYRDKGPTSSGRGHVGGFVSINVKPPATVRARTMATRSTTSGRRLAWVACIQQQDSGEEDPGPWLAMPRVVSLGCLPACQSPIRPI